MLEVLMSSVIFAMISALAYGAMYGTFKTQKTVDDKTAIQELGSSLMLKISSDLNQTFYVDSQRPLTVFQGKNNGVKDSITFSTLSHIPSKDDAKESDQAIVIYETEENPNDPNFLLLKRKEIPFINAITIQDLSSQGEFVTLFNKVTAFDIKYHDKDRVFEQWDIRSQDHLNQLPKLVSIILEIQNENGRTQRFGTTVNIALSENLSQDIQPTPQAASPNQPGSRQNQTNPRKPSQ